MLLKKEDPSSSTDLVTESPHPHGLIKESSGIEDQPARYPKNEEQKAMLKLDLILMPLLSMIFFIASLDRTNIGNARVAGLQSDLRLSDHQFSVVLLLTSIFYTIIKVPATLLLKRMGAHVILPAITFGSGLVVFFQGFVTNFKGLVVTRLFLGLTEGGLYPVIVLYLSQNYSRDQLQLRIAGFYSAASLSGSFSGLLSYAIFTRMDGTWGKQGWAWLFFIEGLGTMVFAVCVAFIFPASIEVTRWLNQREKKVLNTRIIGKLPSHVDEKEKFRISEVIVAFKSPHVLILSATQFMAGIGTYSVQYFTPTIVRSLGYSTSRTQLMTSPPYTVAFVFMLAAGYFSGRYHMRALTAGVGAALGLIGYIIFVAVDPSHTRIKYASLFLTVPGIYSITPPISAWSSDNSFGHYRRASAISISFTTSTFGGIVGSWLYPNSQAPRYQQGIIINLACCGGMVMCVILNCLWLRYSTSYKQKHRNQILEPYGANALDPNSSEFRRAWRELGDKHPDYQYVY